MGEVPHAMRSYPAADTNVVRESGAVNRQINEVLVSFYHRQRTAEGKGWSSLDKLKPPELPWSLSMFFALFGHLFYHLKHWE